MIRKISHITILVKDQDEALDYYTEKLGFVVQADEKLGPGQRWLVVSPKGQDDFGLVLMRADREEDQVVVGKQAGSQVLLVVRTNDCKKTYEELKGRGVEFQGGPKEKPWGLEVVFTDLYGNKFDLLQPKGWG
jgi:catechol 2,3-dioxygenase-like lactoylglutathione lyase family enzyme